MKVSEIYKSGFVTRQKQGGSYWDCVSAGLWKLRIHREYHRNKMYSSRQSNPKRSREILRKSYYKNQELRKRQAKESRERRKEDPIRLERYRLWCRNRVKLRKSRDVQYRIRFLMRNRIWMSLQRGVAKSGRTVELLGCSIPDFKSHLESLWLPGMSWENFGRGGWHIDHKKPCKSFDLTNPEQQKLCFHYTNCQPLWEKDNLSKGAK